MKHILIAVLALSWSLSQPVAAADEHHSADAGSTAAPAGAKTPPANPRAAGAGMPMNMMENMGRMQEQMRRLMQTQDPAERGKLLQEHMRSMQAQMGMMGGMMGHGMMAGGPGMGRPDMPADQRMQKMEQRMDMMQQMMEQMLKHQEQSGGAK